MTDKLDRTTASMEAVFAAIREAHYGLPDLRVGQIIANACMGSPDLFYLENNELAARIRLYAKEPSAPRKDKA